MQTRIVRLLTGWSCSCSWQQESHGRELKVRRQLSGTSVDVPVDIDSDTCGTASNDAIVCTDTSGYSNFAGKISPVDSSARDSSGEGVRGHLYRGHYDTLVSVHPIYIHYVTAVGP